MAILRVGAAAVVAAQPDAHTCILQSSDWRDSAFHLEVALGIKNHACAGCREEIDFIAREPDAVRQIQQRTENSLGGEPLDQ
jgi:hypothetical protein